MKILLALTLLFAPLSADQVRAAFDVGTGQTKITVAMVDDTTGRPLKVLFSEETALLLGHDFKQNKGFLSDKILDELEQLLFHYRGLAEDLGAEEMAGVATAVFRESKNGPDFIKRVEQEMGIDLRVITQVEEGRLGFLTAVAASGKEPGDVVAWDSGGGSFQITTEGDVYEGPWGASKVLAAMVEKVQGRDFTKVQTANPAKLEEVIALQKIIKSALKPATGALMAKIPSSTVVAIGGPFSSFRMASLAIGQTTFTKEQVWQAITQLVGRTDEALANFPEKEMLIPKLTLVYTVMDHFNFPVVSYYPTTGSTLGILMSPQFWGSFVKNQMP